MGRKCFLPLQPSSVAVPGGHNGAFQRGSWKGVLAGRLEVEHCSWGEPNSFPGANLLWVPVSKTKLLFLRAHGGGLSQSWTEGKAISYPLFHPPKLEKHGVLKHSCSGCRLIGFLVIWGAWGGWGSLRGQTFQQTEQANGHRDWQGSEAKDLQAIR